MKISEKYKLKNMINTKLFRVSPFYVSFLVGFYQGWNQVVKLKKWNKTVNQWELRFTKYVAWNSSEPLHTRGGGR